MKRLGSLLSKKMMLLLFGIFGLSGIIVAGVGLVLLIMIIGAIAGGSSSSNDFCAGEYEIGNLSPHVQRYEPTVRKYAKEHGLEEYTPVILGIMQQESGGNPSESDPMQSSESLCGYIGCITNPEHSIAQGLRHFANVIEKADGDLHLAIHSYNFGTGFIDYVKKKNKKYTFNKSLGDGKETFDLAIQFSQEQYNYQASIGNGGIFTCLRPEARPYNACYGDILYVWSVLNYVNVGETNASCDSSMAGVPGSNIPNAKGWIKPLANFEKYPITSNFGPRDIGSGPETHKGTDIAAPIGTPVYAVKEGVVNYIQYYKGDPYGRNYVDGFGSVVFVDHGGGIVSIYAHLSGTNVKLGDKVKQNQQVGVVGSTGRSGGPHLHFEVQINHTAVPALPFIQ